MFMRKVALLVFITAFGATWACKSAPPAAPAASGIDLAGIDKSAAPGDDFNAYTNGGWLKATPIPPDKPSYGIFAILADETRKRTVSLIQDSANAGSNASEEARKTGDFYSSFMDEAAIEAKGIAPLKPQLDKVVAMKDRKDLARAIGESLRADVDALNATNFETENLFGVWVTQGLMDPTRSYPYLLQGGLGLPDREYYLAKTSQMAEVRSKYQQHIAAMLKLAGLTDAATRAEKVFALETKMAGVHATRVESEDVHSAVLWKREELSTKAPGLDWPTLLDAAGLKDAPELIMW